VALAATIALSSLMRKGKPLPKICLFNRATGYPCPFCGLSRSFLNIGHGDLREGALHHPLGIPAYLMTAGLALGTLARGRVRIPLNPPRMMMAASMLLAAWAVKLLFIPRKYW
jgi:hypothetical protein